MSSFYKKIVLTRVSFTFTNTIYYRTLIMLSISQFKTNSILYNIQSFINIKFSKFLKATYIKALPGIKNVVYNTISYFILNSFSNRL